MSHQDNSSRVRVFAVIVLYKIKPSDSVTFNTLQAAIAQLEDGRVDVRVLLYDNTPGGQDIDVLATGVEHKSDIKNGGLAAAYNYAFGVAEEAGFEWLLTLDQDTTLPLDFITKLCSTIKFVAPFSYVAAIVPRIYDGDRLISPYGLLYGTFPRFFPKDFTGVSLKESTSAINSASTFRISALRAIGGYDPRFPLDCSDYALYYHLNKEKLRVFVAGQIRVEHELSVLNMKQRVTPERYEGILGAEAAFRDQCTGVVADISLISKYLYRIFFKQWTSKGNFSYVRTNLRFLCRRIFYSRRHRMKLWEQSVKSHFDI